MQEQRENEYRVAPIELFFDLVFVFALIQLSHHLVDHLSWRGVAETAVMLVAVLSVWSFTSWTATLIPVHKPGSAWMVLTVMLLGLLMNASISKAFATASWGFVVPLLLIHLGRTLWTIIYAPDKAYKEHYIRLLIWHVTTIPLWIIGAMVDEHSRLLWWMAAVIIELVGTWLAHPVPGKRLRSERMPFDADHMVERCSLFVIIALGETVLTTGTSIAKSPTDPMTLLTGSFALVGTMSLWALAFGSAQRHLIRHIEHTIDPVRVSRHAMNAVTIMVAGLLAIAVANKLTIQHPTEHASIVLGIMMGGGPALFLLAQSWYLHAVLNIRSPIHWIGACITALSGLVILVIPPYGAMMVVGLVLASLAAYDWSKSANP